jgi:hypothetical protein
MTATENPNLILNFKMVGDSYSRVRGAARIKVDGCSSLTVYDAGNGLTERIDLTKLEIVLDFHGTLRRQSRVVVASYLFRIERTAGPNVSGRPARKISSLQPGKRYYS